MRVSICLLAFGFLFNSVLAQIFTIHYAFKTNKSLSDSLILQLQKPLQEKIVSENIYYPINSQSFKNEKGYNYNIATYEITDTSCAYIADGFGHEMIIIPGDTLTINLSVKSFSDSGRLNGKYISPWMLDFSYEGKNKFIYSIFDSIAYNTGALHADFISISNFNDNEDQFLDSVTKSYTQRQEYLLKYCNNYNIPVKIKNLVFEEIRSAYLINLVRGYSQNRHYSDKYIALLKNLVFNNEYLFFNTSLYSRLAEMYIIFFQNTFDIENPLAPKRFEDIYYSIKNNYTGRNRDYLIAFDFQQFCKSGEADFDSILTDFKSFAICKECIRFVDSIYKIAKAKSAVTLEQALSAQISNSKSKTMSFKDLFRGRPVLVDCWASWCSPCLRQIPYSEEIKKMYEGKIDLVYISFDKNKDAWISKMRQLKLTGINYFLQKNFKSDFAYYFNISSIPRYLLFDKHGKIITMNAPRPSQKEYLIKLIDKELKNNVE